MKLCFADAIPSFKSVKNTYVTNLMTSGCNVSFLHANDKVGKRLLASSALEMLRVFFVFQLRNVKNILTILMVTLDAVFDISLDDVGLSVVNW